MQKTHSHPIIRGFGGQIEIRVGRESDLGESDLGERLGFYKLRHCSGKPGLGERATWERTNRSTPIFKVRHFLLSILKHLQSLADYNIRHVRVHCNRPNEICVKSGILL